MDAPGSSRNKRCTVEEFHRLSEHGWFDGNRAMLLDGEIIEFPPSNPLHSMSVSLADYALKALFDTWYVVRVQQPLLLSRWTDAEPDIAVVPGSVREFESHPTVALLIVEISDSTLTIDLGEKALLYAAGRIADYWVVDVNGRQLFVFRDPIADASIPTGFRYATRLTFDATATISPLAMPSASIRVADLLP